MNILSWRWSRFKQELPSIICLSSIQILEGLFSPAPMNIKINFFLRSIIGIVLIIHLFSSMDKFAPFFRLEHIESTPYASALTSKKNFVSTLITVFFIGSFFTWYFDFYRMPNSYYLFCFATWILTFALVYRSAHRVDSSKFAE